MTSPLLSPFHEGERLLQERAGVRDKVEALGQRVIRDHLPEQHRAFYAQLPFVFVGHLDNRGYPWASIIAGEPGFIDSPDARTLAVQVQPLAGDPLGKHMHEGMPVGVLGIMPERRRRNRLGGQISEVGNSGFRIAIEQTFGNCPKYIQARTHKPRPTSVQQTEVVRSISGEASRIIGNADTFYVASGLPEPQNSADVSHRGGNPGFVAIDGDTLTVPDFSGNNHFNTLGNFVINPRAGLLFIDYDEGDVLQMTGSVEILADPLHFAEFEGAERAWRFTFERGYLLRQALPFSWSFEDYSPQLAATGTWG